MFALPHEAVAKITINVSIHCTDKKPICFCLTALRSSFEIFNIQLDARELPNLAQENAEQHLVWDHGFINLGNDLAPFTHENVWVTVIELKLKMFVGCVKRNIIHRAEVI